MKIFAGSSNPKLAKKIAKQLGIKLGRIELSRFANGEARVRIREKIIKEKAVIVQSFSYPPDEHLIEFFLIADALKRLGAKKIIAVIPWLGYCVQDKVFLPGEPLSAKVIAQIIQSLKIDRLITLDLHNETITGFFDLVFNHLSALPVFINFFKQKQLRINLVISPDAGGIKRAAKLAKGLNLAMTVINKERDLITGKVSILGFNSNLKAKRVLIVDDFISTGGTLIKISHFLKKAGVKKIYAATIHHFYIKGVQEKIDKSPIDKIFVSDTINSPLKLNSKKLKIISVSNLLAKELKNC